MDLIEVLQQAAEATPEDAMLSDEIAQQLGWNIDKVRKALKEKLELGLVVCVPVKRRNIAGITHTRPGYRMVKNVQDSEVT